MFSIRTDWYTLSRHTHQLSTSVVATYFPPNNEVPCEMTDVAPRLNIKRGNSEDILASEWCLGAVDVSNITRETNSQLLLASSFNFGFVQ